LKIQTIKKWVKPLGMLLMIASLVFIINRIAKLDIDFTLFFSVRSLMKFIAVTLFYAFAVFILANCWRVILTLTAKKETDKRLVNSIFIKSNLFKYLPGNVMHLVGRNLLGSELNIPQRNIAAATFIEITFMCAVSFILAILTGWQTLSELIRIGINKANGVLVVAVVVILAVAIICAFTVLKKKLNEHLTFVAFKAALKCCAGYTAFFLILTLSFTFLLPLDFADLRTLKIPSAVIISWLAGFIVIGAPGGIGIREAVLLFVLNGSYGETEILYAAILQRFAMILGEVIIFVMVIFLRRRTNAIYPPDYKRQ
jgi:hypothetical protein